MRNALTGGSLALALLASLFVIGAGSAQPPKPVIVFAASSLTDAFNAMKPQFEKEHPGTAVRLNFGASSQLRTQIEQGAPVDVFASADNVQMQPLVGKMVAAPVVFARNRLVVALPASNPGKVRSLHDLGRPGLRVVTTAEAVPIGKYTRQVLEKLNADYGPDYAGKVNANVVSRENNVRGVLAKVELGEADAAFVYETDAASTSKVSVIKVPEKRNVIAEYPIAVVNAARDRPLPKNGSGSSSPAPGRRCSSASASARERSPIPIYFYSPLEEPYGPFSNFSRHGVKLDGHWWLTVEHFFQAQKFAGTPHAEEVRQASGPKRAAEVGRDRKRPLREDWEDVKDEVMRRGVLEKFRHHAGLRQLLLSTGDEEIVENAPHDYYWGSGSDGSGRNMLGRILMETRELLRADGPWGVSDQPV